MTTGAIPPRSVGLPRFTQVVPRVLNAVRAHRAGTRERNDALRTFYTEFGLRPGASPQDVLDAVARRRGRPLTYERVPQMPAGVSGMAIFGEDRDTIVISDRLSPRHSVRVLLHEARHLCTTEEGCGVSPHVAMHHTHDALAMENLTAQMSVLPSRVVQEIMNRPVKFRASYTYSEELTGEELTCEIFAAVVLPLINVDEMTQSAGSLAVAFGNRRAL